MAVIAIHAVPHVPVDTVVLRIGIRFGMAIGALKHRVVVGVRVAGGANTIRAAVIGREPCVVEGGARPCRCCVAGGAGRRELGRDVVRVGRAGVLRLMAGVAVGGSPGEDVVYVALCAGYGSMGARQRKGRLAVVETSARPAYRRVAGKAGRGEARSLVVRVSGVVEVRSMAGVAVCGKGGEVTVHMAERALD